MQEKKSIKQISKNSLSLIFYETAIKTLLDKNRINPSCESLMFACNEKITTYKGAFITYIKIYMK